MNTANTNSGISTLAILKKITLVDDQDSLLLDIINQSKKNSEMLSIGFINQHAFNLMYQSADVHDNFMGLDFLLRDGIGIKLALNLFNFNPKLNLNGTDLIPALVSKTQSSETDYYVFGTESPWLEKGCVNLIPNGNYKALDGFKEFDDYLNFLKKNLNSQKFNVIILAMGMPKQEALVTLIKQNISMPGLIICGGAIIDFQASRFKRAPRWIRQLSLEWLYRFIKEPKRLFKRYLIGIPVFFTYIVLNKIRN